MVLSPKFSLPPSLCVIKLFPCRSRVSGKSGGSQRGKKRSGRESGTGESLSPMRKKRGSEEVPDVFDHLATLRRKQKSQMERQVFNVHLLLLWYDFFCAEILRKCQLPLNLIWLTTISHFTFPRPHLPKTPARGAKASPHTKELCYVLLNWVVKAVSFPRGVSFDQRSLSSSHFLSLRRRKRVKQAWNVELAPCWTRWKQKGHSSLLKSYP